MHQSLLRIQRIMPLIDLKKEWLCQIYLSCAGIVVYSLSIHHLVERKTPSVCAVDLLWIYGRGDISNYQSHKNHTCVNSVDSRFNDRIRNLRAKFASL
jgi:hypothetical protein